MPANVASSNTADNTSPHGQCVLTGVALGGEHQHLRPVHVDAGSPLAVPGHRERAADVDPFAFRRRDQRAVRYAVDRLERRCPPVEFGVVGRVVQPQRFGELGGLGQFGPGFVGDHVQLHGAVPGVGPQDRFERFPIRRRRKGQPVGAARQDRVGAATVRVGDEIHRAEVDRGQVVEVVRVGEALDVGLPTGGGDRDAQMVEHHPAADDRLTSRAVRGMHDAVAVDEQLQAGAVCHPPPGLAVVQRRGAARQLHGALDDFGVHHGVRHDTKSRRRRRTALGPLVPNRGDTMPRVRDFGALNRR